MKLRWVKSLFFLLILIASCLLFYYLFSKNNLKIGYVRTIDLVEGFEGMKQAKKDFEIKYKSQKEYMDTLQLILVSSTTKYEQTHAKEDFDNMQKAQNYLYQYNDYFGKLTKEEDQKSTQVVLNQINQYVKNYGEIYGYDIIEGATSQGNILYGSVKCDITEDVLDKINNMYKGKK